MSAARIEPKTRGVMRSKAKLTGERKEETQTWHENKGEAKWGRQARSCRGRPRLQVLEFGVVGGGGGDEVREDTETDTLFAELKWQLTVSFCTISPGLACANFPNSPAYR